MNKSGEELPEAAPSQATQHQTERDKDAHEAKENDLLNTSHTLYDQRSHSAAQAFQHFEQRLAHRMDGGGSHAQLQAHALDSCATPDGMRLRNSSQRDSTQRRGGAMWRDFSFGMAQSSSMGEL
jgi:hypothetical protein